MRDSIPRWARWPLAYLAVVAACFAVGRPTPLGFGNAMFLAGAVALGWSLTHVRLGGSKTMVGRDPDGKPVYTLDAPKRKAEIRRGLALFAFALALWLPLGVYAYLYA